MGRWGRLGWDLLGYEVRPGGNRPVREGLWDRFDEAFRALIAAGEGTDARAVAQAHREAGEALLEIASQLADEATLPADSHGRLSPLRRGGGRWGERATSSPSTPTVRVRAGAFSPSLIVSAPLTAQEPAIASAGLSPAAQHVTSAGPCGEDIGSAAAIAAAGVAPGRRYLDRNDSTFESPRRSSPSCAVWPDSRGISIQRMLVDDALNRSTCGWDGGRLTAYDVDAPGRRADALARRARPCRQCREPGGP